MWSGDEWCVFSGVLFQFHIFGDWKSAGVYNFHSWLRLSLRVSVTGPHTIGTHGHGIRLLVPRQARVGLDRYTVSIGSFGKSCSSSREATVLWIESKWFKQGWRLYRRTVMCGKSWASYRVFWVYGRKLILVVWRSNIKHPNHDMASRTAGSGDFMWFYDGFTLYMFWQKVF